MYKVKSRYGPKIFSDLFNQREISPYNLRRHPEFRVPLTRTMYHGSQSISCLSSNIWNILSPSFKEAVLLRMGPTIMSCRLCKNYIPGAYHKSASFLIIDFLIYLLQWFSWFSPFFYFYGIFRNQMVYIHRVGYRNSTVEHFVIIVKGFQPFIIITKNSI